MKSKATRISRRSAPARTTRSVTLPHFEVTLDAETETNFYTGLEGSISTGGLFIATYDIHPPGTSLSVNARLPSGRILKKKVIVEWVRGYDERAIDFHPGMGVVFEQIGEDDEEEIRSFMTNREAIFYEAM